MIPPRKKTATVRDDGGESASETGQALGSQLGGLDQFKAGIGPNGKRIQNTCAHHGPTPLLGHPNIGPTGSEKPIACDS